VGLVRGDGHRNTQRVYWHNKGTTNISDDPSEARLEPQQWGVIQVKPMPRFDYETTTARPVVPEDSRSGLRTAPDALWQHGEGEIAMVDQSWEHADEFDIRLTWWVEKSPTDQEFGLCIDNLRVLGSTMAGEEIELARFNAEEGEDVPFKDVEAFPTAAAAGSQEAAMDLGQRVHHATRQLTADSGGSWHWHGNERLPLPKDLDRRVPLRLSMDAGISSLWPRARLKVTPFVEFYQEGQKVGSVAAYGPEWRLDQH